MSDEQPSNALEVRQERDVAARRDTDSWTAMAPDVFRLAEHIAQTAFVPKGLRNSAPAVAAAVLYGREVGLPPMTSLNSVYVVDGSPTLSAETMRALVLAAGHEIVFAESTGSRCLVRGRRRGGAEWSHVEWTLDMARAAGLTGKDNWKKYPRRMLQARASSELCELVFPDVIAGFRALEDVEDQADVDGAGETEQPAVTVQRSGGTRKRAAKKAAPKPTAAPADAPPLPGDDGFDEGSTTEQARESEEGEAEGSGADETGGEGGASPSSPSLPDEQSDEPPLPDEEEPVEGVVEEEPPVDEQDEPPAGVVDAEVVGESTDQPAPRPISKAQLRMLHAMLGERGLRGDEHRNRRLHVVSVIVGRNVESTSDLTAEEAGGLLDTIGLAETAEGLRELVDGIKAEGKGGES